MPFAPLPPVAWLPLPQRGRLRLSGRDRQAFLHNLTTSDVQALKPGTGQPGALVNQRAGILDWLFLYATPDALLLVTGDGRAEADRAWLERYLFSEDVQLTDLTGETAIFYLTGSDAAQVAGAIAPLPQGPFALTEGHLAGYPLQFLGTYGLEGPGYFVLAPAPAEPAICGWLSAHGPALSPAEYEHWRLAGGLPAYGPELNESHNPWEARLDESISLHKGCYLGQEIVARLNTYHKVQRYLVGLRLPRPVSLEARLYAGEQEVGALTSLSATEEGALALGYVKAAFAEPGTPLSLRDGVDTLATQVEERPFWAGKTRTAGLAPRS